MDTFVNAFNRFDSSLNNGNGFSELDNLEGMLAWQEAPIMMSYVAMYRATKNPEYLRRLIAHIDRVLIQRDDNQGRSDYRGIIRPTWVSTIYSEDKKKPCAWIVHSGMITYPMADFVYLVTSEASLHNQTTASGELFSQAAQRIAGSVAETIAAHDDEWSDIRGVYKHRPDAPVKTPGEALPHNQYAALGRTLVAMYLATHRPEYLYKVIKLAFYFSSSLDIDSGAYIWHYEETLPILEELTVYEDISHGSIEVDFAVLCQENGIVFNSADVARFASTFTENVYLAPGRFANRVDGNDGEGEHHLATANWLPLSRVRPDMFQIVSDAWIDRALYSTEEGSGAVFLAIANLERFHGLFETIAVNRSPGPASQWAGVAAGDFDGDGREEFVAVRNFDGNFFMYRLDNNGVIEPVAELIDPGSDSKWAGVAAGDFDGDGRDEFVAVRNFDGNFFMYRLNDSGVIESVAELTSPGSDSEWAGVAAGDFDGDGRDEFVAVRNFDGNFFMYRLNDSGVIESVAELTTPGSDSKWVGVAAGDFNGDGRDEFVAVRNFDGNFFMYRLNADRTIESEAVLTDPGSGSDWMGIAAGDFDGDGNIEFIANRNFDGDFYMYRLSGGVIHLVLTEFFPTNLQNGVIAGGKLLPSQSWTPLIMLRNHDGHMFVFRVNGN